MTTTVLRIGSYRHEGFRRQCRVLQQRARSLTCTSIAGPILLVLITGWIAHKRKEVLSHLRRYLAESVYWCEVSRVFLKSVWLSLTQKPTPLPQGLTNGHPYPVVIVPGLMSMGRNYPAHYLGEKGVVAELSPYASSHDRAVELFYLLKGGQVDYGEEHSQRYGHERFGTEVQAKLPDWDQSEPLVIIAHSHGGNTARMLQHLLSIGFFPGYKTSADWIKAIICIASPMNGCPVLHGLGMPLRSASSGAMSPTARGVRQGQGVGSLFSLVRVGQTLGYILHWALGDYRWSRHIYDWGLDSWRLTRLTGGWRQLWHLLYGDHHILNTDDTAGYDLTFDGATNLNDMLAELNGNTFYFSLPCSWTSQSSSWLMPKDRPVPLPTNTASLIPLGALIASCTPQAIPSDCTEVRWDPSEWRENDTIVPLRSQLRPMPRDAQEADEFLCLDDWTPVGDTSSAVVQGKWHVLKPSRVDHRAAMHFAPPLDMKLKQILQVIAASAESALVSDEWCIVGSASEEDEEAHG